MKLTKPKSSTATYVVIAGYILLIILMIIGLIAVYRNLVNFSEKKIREEDLSELILVGNTISKLYEIESSQNLINADLARQYFQKYDSILPLVRQNIDTLKSLSKNEERRIRLDSIEIFLSMKEKNLRDISWLLDSLKKAPLVKTEVQSSYVPKTLNKNIRDYLNKSNKQYENERVSSDTTVVKTEKKSFAERLRNVFVPRSEDSVLMIREERTPFMNTSSFNLVVDTVVNMVRYYERLDRDRQRMFQQALLARQATMNYNNTQLTSRIDDLLKIIENEELEKSIQLLSDKNKALSDSQSTVFWVSLLATLIGVVFGLLFLIDVNKSQRYRKQLEESNHRIRYLLDTREKLMLSISHDIKAPMSSILGYIELMEPPINEQKKAQYLNNMKNSSEHVLQLVMNLLDFHKLDSGKWTRKDISYNIHDLIENTASSFRPIAEQKELEFIIHNQLDEQLMSYGDPYMLRQVLSNLISNAVKFTQKGFIKVTAQQEDVPGEKPWIRLSVKDTGVGIDKENQQLIFQEFSQIEQKEAPSIEGSGLGLAIVKGLVDELGGSVSLESGKGPGSEFIVRIPLRTAKQAAYNVPNIRSNSYQFDGISVLLVDDDQVQLTMASEMLKTKNATVVTETRPDNVLQILNANEFDIIFIDIQMPGMNGFALVKKIRELEAKNIKTIPIIALSAKSDVPRNDLESAGFSDFLSKPFTSEQLFFTVYHFVNRLSEKKKFDFSLKSKTDTGVAALIDFVKDDKNASLDILRAFVEDTERNTEKIKKAFVEYDLVTSSQMAHKMLPLFKMIGDEKLIDYLSTLENKIKISQEEKEETAKRLDHHIREAKELIGELEKE